MNSIAASALCAALPAFVMVGSAQAVKPSPASQTTPAPGASQTARAPFTPSAPDQRISQSRPLFVVGGVPVVVWAPVQPPYNGRMSRTAAAGPLWDPDAF